MPSLQWPAMTMDFLIEDRAALGAVKKGERIEFELKAQPNAQGDYLIEKLRRLP